MTKTRLFTGRAGRDNITEFDLVIGNDDSVDQQFDQLTLLLKAGLFQ
jgi:hypothetical protein